MDYKIKKVFSLHKALQLKQLGNEILFIEENHKNKNLKVFCFENTNKLKQDWDIIEDK